MNAIMPEVDQCTRFQGFEAVVEDIPIETKLPEPKEVETVVSTDELINPDEEKIARKPRRKQVTNNLSDFNSFPAWSKSKVLFSQQALLYFRNFSNVLYTEYKLRYLSIIL